MYNLPRERSRFFLSLRVTTESNYAPHFFPSCISFYNKENVKAFNSECLRDESLKMHGLAREHSIHVASYADKFSRVKICLDTFYYLGDRKVPDHSNDGQDRFTSRSESGEPDVRRRCRLRLHRLGRRRKGIRRRKWRERELVPPDGANHSRIDNGTSVPQRLRS